MYVVSYSKAHEASTEYGQFETFEEAEQVARNRGAVGDGQKHGKAYVYDVSGHQGDDDYAIWIERA